MSVIVSEDALNAGTLLSQFEANTKNAGGVVSFSGIVRGQKGENKVRALLLQSYSPLTENGIQAAVEDAKQRWPLTSVLVHHRIGEIQVGETIVFVATASEHRRDAFEAADFLMDYLKTEAVFWKKEITETAETWIEPRKEDYQDKLRWN
ncbi:molybdenum cofactor biosynthesis protein MoaE [Ponticaulis sp.]|uniref:molybdenum cofactor biosynthesis protein MoaE n=1 Tax=Ponticaulis sp. TaxID=2020902 RepID=UPI000B7207C3|nr:molybdenum cofactor biosynthesis protein MoaE [Ponticaulis sp.]MAI89512.1 molybdenum cofactor biosynthesis protein MoaE [Ponticaulis sp.]OUY00546.1 MAG: molybdenum cofactor biosynthesis protein MoaE [Hyphomonadaceae bacterium TMED5]|tara:strand:+ start:172746 stop:173195 length:450 start_codon:yes stop_codon:yes gene_type:complete